MNTLDVYINAISKSISAIDTENFYKEIADNLESATHYESAAVIAYPRNDTPRVLYHDLSPEQVDSTIEVYLKGGYLLDPFYRLLENDNSDGLHILNDIAPEDFYNSEYYKAYYGKSELTDEAGILVTIDENMSIIISLGVRNKSAVPSGLSFELLRMYFPIFKNLCLKHAEITGPFQDTSYEETMIGSKISEAFNAFGSSVLSAREKEILQLMLKGFSSKEIGTLLGISSDTVKVHRKHIHQKLEVNTHAELFSLFLSAISLIDKDSEGDPLTLYHLKV